MKPLTIEQLKALPVGEWVWIESQEIVTKYYKKNASDKISSLTVDLYDDLEINLPYSEYGSMWVAYKNKEQAEAKGEIVELPCNIGDTVYYSGLYDCEKNYIDEQDEKTLKEMSDYCKTVGGTCHECKYAKPIIKTTICEEIRITKDGVFIDDFSGIPFAINELSFTESEAEARLKELKGEK